MTGAAVEDEDGFTELRDATVPRVDGVSAAANGTPWFFAKQAEGPAGLLETDFVRELIAKADTGSTPDSAPREMVTMTGSPAAIAALIHNAPVRKSTPTVGADEVEKAEASTASMNDRPDSDFAYVEPGGTKDEHGRTVPRSKRHFPIYDAAHVRNALARAPQSPFGDKAMPRIRAAAKRFGIDVSKEIDMAVVTGDIDDGIDGMDPTVPLAAPDEDKPGDPSEPGSPAWEAIDAATATKWVSILGRAKSALRLLADRELLEAATADPDDAQAACDLEDAACAIDYAIEILATFAACEQIEADCAGDAMEALGKALGGFDPAPLELIEGLAPLKKAGRVLSSANEAAIRGAVEQLQKVLASLPQAPTTDEEGGRAVAKTANEESDMPTPTLSEDVTAQSGQTPAMGTKQADPKPVAGTAVTDLAKADGDAKPDMVAVYDAKGNLVGVVDPGEITRIATAEAPAMNDTDSTDAMGDEGAQPGPAAAAAPTDLTPAPSADAGTPADEVGKGATGTADAASAATTQDVLKSSDITTLVKAALDDYSATQAEIVKRLEGQGKALEERNTHLTNQLAEQVTKNADLAARLTNLEQQPAVMAIASNGAVPRPPQLRGQDYGAPGDVSQALALRKQLAEAPDAVTRKNVADQMQELALGQYEAMRQRGAAL